MGWIKCESFGFGSRAFDDELGGREAAKGLQASPKVVGVEEARVMTLELLVVFVVEARDRCVLDGAVHAFDLAVGPGVLDFGEVVFDPELYAAHVEHVRDEGCGRSVGVAWREG